MLQLHCFLYFFGGTFPRGGLCCWALPTLPNFVLFQFVIRCRDGEVGLMTDETLVCVPSEQCLYSLMVRVD